MGKYDVLADTADEAVFEYFIKDASPSFRGSPLDIADGELELVFGGLPLSIHLKDSG